RHDFAGYGFVRGFVRGLILGRLFRGRLAEGAEGAMKKSRKMIAQADDLLISPFISPFRPGLIPAAAALAAFGALLTHRFRLIRLTRLGVRPFRGFRLARPALSAGG